MTTRSKLLARTMFIALSAAAAQPAVAQTPQVIVGAAVKDMAGGDVGTVTATDGIDVTVKTDRYEVRLPASSMAPYQGAFLINLSRDELNAEVSRVLADSTMAPAGELAAAPAVPADLTSGAGTADPGAPPN